LSTQGGVISGVCTSAGGFTSGGLQFEGVFSGGGNLWGDILRTPK